MFIDLNQAGILNVIGMEIIQFILTEKLLFLDAVFPPPWHLPLHPFIHSLTPFERGWVGVGVKWRRGYEMRVATKKNLRLKFVQK